MYPGSQESQRSSGVHQASYCQLGEGKDCHCILCTAAASPGALGALLGNAEHQKHQTMRECAQEGTGTERSEVQSFIGIDCLLRLGPSHNPQPAMKHRAHMGHELDSILARHAEPGIFCPHVFHLTSYRPPSHCPRKGPEPT